MLYVITFSNKRGWSLSISDSAIVVSEVHALSCLTLMSVVTYNRIASLLYSFSLATSARRSSRVDHPLSALYAERRCTSCKKLIKAEDALARYSTSLWNFLHVAL